MQGILWLRPVQWYQIQLILISRRCPFKCLYSQWMGKNPDLKYKSWIGCWQLTAGSWQPPITGQSFIHRSRDTGAQIKLGLILTPVCLSVKALKRTQGCEGDKRKGGRDNKKVWLLYMHLYSNTVPTTVSNANLAFNFCPIFKLIPKREITGSTYFLSKN